ncbi:12609_t:CDS:2, partial [Racocetra persica]
DVVMNCTGVSARTFGGVMDNTVSLSHHDSFIFVVPRESGEVILGGTMEMNDYSENPDPETAKNIIQRCVILCPELTLDKNLQIIRHNVGRRPYRTKQNTKGEVTYKEVLNYMKKQGSKFQFTKFDEAK